MALALLLEAILYVLPAVGCPVSCAQRAGNQERDQRDQIKFEDALSLLASSGEAGIAALRDKAVVHHSRQLELSVVDIAAFCGAATRLESLWTSTREPNASKKVERWTPLHYAVAGGSWECCELALRLEPSLIRVSNRYGRLPVHVAAIYGDLRVYRKLVEVGSDADLRDAAGFSAADYLALKGQATEIERLIGPPNNARIDVRYDFACDDLPTILLLDRSSRAVDTTRVLFAAWDDGFVITLRSVRNDQREYLLGFIEPVRVDVALDAVWMAGIALLDKRVFRGVHSGFEQLSVRFGRHMYSVGYDPRGFAARPEHKWIEIAWRGVKAEFAAIRIADACLVTGEQIRGRVRGFDLDGPLADVWERALK